MIVQQITQILESDDEAPTELNRLVDQFRGDRNSEELLELINSASDELARIGTWILSEIRHEKYDKPKFLHRLHELTRHQSPAIRLHSLSALYPFLSIDNPKTFELISRLRKDENEGIRMAAEAAALRLGIMN